MIFLLMMHHHPVVHLRFIFGVLVVEQVLLLVDLVAEELVDLL
jgi:hypothetical protein